MLKIFTGDDRIRANQEIHRLLGTNYEVIDGADLAVEDLTDIFHGKTLFDDVRHILIRDLYTNKTVFAELPNFLDTPHAIILLESKLDKRSAAYKALNGKVEIMDFKLPERYNQFYSFDICRTAKTNGEKAVQMLREIEPTSDPILFLGALTSVALRDFGQRQGTREKQVIKELAVLDLQLKTAPTSPWLLIEGFLLRMSTIH